MCADADVQKMQENRKKREDMCMQKNDTVVVEITDIGVNGEGIGKIDGYTLFIKDAVIGDVAEVKVIKAKKNYGYARLINVLEPSNSRVEPKCPFARKCGGCQIQEMSYEKQLEFKERKVRGNLERIGGFPSELLERTKEPIIGMETPFYYRNKAQFPFGTDKEGNPVTGFYAGRTHDIIANTNCILGAAVNEHILESILDFMKKYKIRSYDEKTGTGLFRHVLLRYGFTTKEIMVCFVVNKDKADKSGEWFPHQKELVEELAKIDGMTSITASPNTKRTNVIMGDTFEVLWGQGYITDYIGSVKYQISPLSFYQVNPVQTEKLYSQALEYAGLKGDETVWDLYCGIGTISLFLAQKAKMVRGVEIIPAAIENAKENARLNGFDNTEFFVGKAEEVLPEQFARTGERADVIVVDPPRKGCDETLLSTIIEMQPDRVVYVSCDSATLARDLKYLCERGYELKKVCPVDMFPNTVSVETVVLLSQLKQKPDNYINVTIELDDMDITSAETKATYDEIKKYVAEHNAGMKVSNLYISQVKRKCGIEVGKNYNLPKNEDSRQPQCPEDKESAIVEALKHFKMNSY